MNNWDLPAILLAAAVLVLAMPREDGFLLPERRDWWGWFRRLNPRVRRRREEAAGREAERYVTDLRTDRDQDPMTVRQDQLPSAVRIYRGPLVSPPTGQRPPWKTSENPSWTSGAQAAVPPEVPPEKPRRRAPGDPPTIVIEIMRPAVEGDLGNYLARLPVYDDDDWSAGDTFVPRASLALGTPDDDGAPEEDSEGDGKEHGFHPGQPGAPDAPVEQEDVGERRPADYEFEQDDVPPPVGPPPRPEHGGGDREGHR